MDTNTDLPVSHVEPLPTSREAFAASRGTWAIKYQDTNGHGDWHQSVTIDVIAGKFRCEAEREARIHKDMSWVAGRKYFAERIV